MVAIGGVATLLALGVLPYEDALDVLSNPAPWTIAAMFLVMGALVRTGSLEVVTSYAQSGAQKRPKLAMAGIGALVVVASAFMNNTPRGRGDAADLRAAVRRFSASRRPSC